MTTAGPTAAIPADSRGLLIVCPSWVGDTVMATPFLGAVRAARPGARIVALVRPGLQPLLSGCPSIDALLSGRDRGALGPFRVARLLRSAKCDTAVLLPNSFRSALTVRLAGIRRRIGFDRDGRGRLLTHAIALPGRRDRPMPLLEYYGHLADAAIGSDRVNAPMTLAVTEAQAAAADTLLSDAGTPLVVLNPGGNKAAKRWPADRFAAVADHLAAGGVTVALTGSPGERDVIDAVLAAAATTPIDLVAAGVDLGSLKGVLRRADLLITNDTGPRHMAAALGTPIVTIFGPTDHRWTMLPEATERRLLAEPFLPEDLVADDHATLCDVDRISVGDVLAASAALLDAGSG